MNLEEQIANTIMTAFDDLGGNPLDAVRAARQHVTAENWIQQETAKIALAGGAEMIIPGLHTLTIPAGITYLLHTMAKISWGIGALKGALIVETPHYSDLRNILTLWAEGGLYNASILDYQAIAVDALTYAVTAEGAELIQAQLAAADPATSDITTRTLTTLGQIASTYAGDERMFELVKVVAGYGAAQDAQRAASERRVLSTAARDTEFTPSRRISARLATRLAARIGMRLPAKWLVGFVPLAGAVVNGFLNAQTLRSMSDAALRYYERSFRREQLVSFKEG